MLRIEEEGRHLEVRDLRRPVKRSARADDGMLEVTGQEARSAATVRYEGEFELAWLGDGERVMSAGDGTGAAIIVLTDGNELRVNIGDEIPVKSAPGQAPSSPNGWRPASETETAGGSSSAKRDRLACWLCNQILNHLATPWYRKMVSGSIRYGLLAAASDEREGAPRRG